MAPGKPTSAEAAASAALVACGVHGSSLPERVAVCGTLRRGDTAWHLLEPLVAAHEGAVELTGMVKLPAGWPDP